MDKKVMAEMFNKKSRGIKKKVFLDFITKEEDMPMRKRKSLMVSGLNNVIARNGEELEIVSVRRLQNEADNNVIA